LLTSGGYFTGEAETCQILIRLLLFVFIGFASFIFFCSGIEAGACSSNRTGDDLLRCLRAVPESSRKICLAHWPKSKCRKIWQLYQAEGMKLESENTLELLELLRQEPRPPTLPGRLERLVHRCINCRRGPLWKINQLFRHIERTWQQVSDDTAERTNNATDRIIGLDYKIRAKTGRGFKAWPKD